MVLPLAGEAAVIGFRPYPPCEGIYCAAHKIGDTPIGTAQSGGRAEPWRFAVCKGEGLPHERSSAGTG